jgi:hypothetical protein
LQILFNQLSRIFRVNVNFSRGIKRFWEDLCRIHVIFRILRELGLAKRKKGVVAMQKHSMEALCLYRGGQNPPCFEMAADEGENTPFDTKRLTAFMSIIIFGASLGAISIHERRSTGHESFVLKRFTELVGQLHVVTYFLNSRSNLQCTRAIQAVDCIDYNVNVQGRAVREIGRIVIRRFHNSC